MPTAGTSASTARPTSRRSRASGRSSTSGPATSGTRCSTPRSGKVGVYICYDRHFPEGWRALGLNGAQIVFNPSATSRGLSMYLWQLEQPAPPWPTSTSSARSTASASRPSATTTSTGRSYFVDPRGPARRRGRERQGQELVVRDLDLDKLAEVRDRWQFYRDRRPDTYGAADGGVTRR